jgi:hypothetical protein
MMWLIINVPENPLMVNLAGAILHLATNENRLYLMLPTRTLYVEFASREDARIFYDRISSAIQSGYNYLDTREQNLTWITVQFADGPLLPVTITNQPTVDIGSSPVLTVHVNNRVPVDVVNRPVVDAAVFTAY